jgi:hypothetical protein
MRSVFGAAAIGLLASGPAFAIAPNCADQLAQNQGGDDERRVGSVEPGKEIRGSEPFVCVRQGYASSGSRAGYPRGNGAQTYKSRCAGKCR